MKYFIVGTYSLEIPHHSINRKFVHSSPYFSNSFVAVDFQRQRWPLEYSDGLPLLDVDWLASPPSLGDTVEVEEKEESEGHESLANARGASGSSSPVQTHSLAGNEDWPESAPEIGPKKIPVALDDEQRHSMANPKS